MKEHTIKKSIDINTPKEIVWDVLLNDKFTRNWYAEFSEGTYAETDWREGSKAVFTDNSNCGLISKVIVNKPFEIISMEYLGMVVNGVEDYDSEVAQSVKGGFETYRLSEKNDVTRLSIECDMSEDMFESMSHAWEKALQKIKNLSEAQKQVQL